MLLPNSAAAGDDGKFVSAARHYDTYCVQCHGVNRNGKGINSRDMSVQPRDHSDAKGMGDIPNEEIFHVIKDGGRSEEHTSELQSLMRISYAVFCLKKKKTETPRS